MTSLSHDEQTELLQQRLSAALDGSEIEDVDVVAIMSLLLSLPVVLSPDDADLDLLIGRDLAASIVCKAIARADSERYVAMYDYRDTYWKRDVVTKRVYEWIDRLRVSGIRFRHT